MLHRSEVVLPSAARAARTAPESESRGSMNTRELCRDPVRRTPVERDPSEIFVNALT